MDWTELAACRDYDPELWFADEESPDTAAAIDVCNGCQARFECLELALASRAPAGVWGGYTTRQRERVARGELPGRLRQQGAA